MLDSIDSFVNLPLLIAAGAGLVLFILLLIAKIRNAAKVSFIFFPCIGVLVAGLLYTYFDHKLFYISIITLILEFFLIAYAFVLAVSDPAKRAEKKAKKEKEAEENLNSEEVSKEAVAALENKYKAIIEDDKELTVKASSYFNEENSLSQFLEFFNKLIVQKTGADGGTVLVLDEFDNILAVKAVTGVFPPPYKIPDDIPHKQLRVETNFKYSQYSLEGNVFGDFFTRGIAENITNSAKDKRIFQNGPEDFLRVGPYMFIPVKQMGESVALAVLARKPDSEPFSKKDLRQPAIFATVLPQRLFH